MNVHRNSSDPSRLTPVVATPSLDPSSLYDRVADRFDQPPLGFWSLLGSRLVELAGLKPGQSVLDIGSGTGAVSLAAARAVHPHGSVLGIDVAPHMVETARQRAREANVSGVRYLHADAATYGMSQPYDAIVGGFSLFFLPDMREALWRFLQWTAPHGTWAFSFWAERGFPPLGEILLRDLAEEIPTLPQEIAEFRHRYANPVALVELFGSFGGRTSLISEAQPYRVSNLEQWWTLATHTGLRGFIDRVAPGRLDAFKQRHFERVKQVLGKDSCFTIELPVHYLVVHFD